jgi:hypothetical protein
MSVTVNAAVLLEMQWLCLSRSRVETINVSREVENLGFDQNAKNDALAMLHKKMANVSEGAILLLEMAFANQPLLRMQNALRLDSCGLIIAEFTGKKFSWAQ